MHWNHRVIQFESEEDGKYWEVREVFYNADGSLMGYAGSCAGVRWFAVDEPPSPVWILQMLTDATTKPVLKEADFPNKGRIDAP